ncbi:hypothetical protein AC578_5027 [Pseudocercospora eumusae]|uniref:Uncharacterized protein n=1 Tax=Pseudocercospora eumusae TaxID=321146 RepID=A0A139H622_9PEZI|nr:hypothetical protein AC578_5027 [Pseudocercospora eumusae]
MTYLGHSDLGEEGCSPEMLNTWQMFHLPGSTSLEPCFGIDTLGLTTLCGCVELCLVEHQKSPSTSFLAPMRRGLLLGMLIAANEKRVSDQIATSDELAAHSTPSNVPCQQQLWVLMIWIMLASTGLGAPSHMIAMSCRLVGKIGQLSQGLPVYTLQVCNAAELSVSRTMGGSVVEGLQNWMSAAKPSGVR